MGVESVVSPTVEEEVPTEKPDDDETNDASYCTTHDGTGVRLALRRCAAGESNSGRSISGHVEDATVREPGCTQRQPKKK